MIEYKPNQYYIILIHLWSNFDEGYDPMRWAEFEKEYNADTSGARIHSAVYDHLIKDHPYAHLIIFDYDSLIKFCLAYHHQEFKIVPFDHENS